MVIMIDNYDSFTYNLVQVLACQGHNVNVYKNDSIEVNKIFNSKTEFIIISPGPGRPRDSGISLDIVQQNRGRYPLIGVCLGHQVIAEAFGARIIESPLLMHGKISKIYHDQKTIFKEIPNPFNVVRYHSLTVDKSSLPECLEISAWTKEGNIMGIRHKSMIIEGVQFHPESMLTEYGPDLLQNFADLVNSKTLIPNAVNNL
ncbi:MAG: aminodeoxychorismate/anthranilate synthase component II [Clostridiales bacterium]|nr:aminodeoxychorismate/anthranilate synthase component II [Clostridiales bacterium]MCF8023430.1 aminodeoxychorismate/anthranilate synthase component II [Clostridiales bacterium]